MILDLVSFAVGFVAGVLALALGANTVVWIKIRRDERNV